MNLNLFLIVREAQKHDQSAQGFTGNSFMRERFNQLYNDSSVIRKI